MSKVDLTIITLQNDMTVDEVIPKMAKLYNVSEDRFEGLYKSLFIMKEQYVLFKQIDESVANAQLDKLVALGLSCEVGNESGGLSLVPVTKPKEAEVICPACDQAAGNAEMCQNCGVIMHKYLSLKQSDEQFQRESNAVNSSEEKMKQLHEERSKKQKDRNNLQKKVEKSDKVSEPDDVPEVFTVNSNDKTSKLVYASVLSVFLVLGGAGYVVQGLVKNSEVEEETFVVNSAASSANTVSTSLDAASTATMLGQDEPLVVVQQTAFDRSLQREQELEDLQQRLDRLYEQNMLHTAAGIVSSQEDPRDRLFGKQEILKIEGSAPDTAEKLDEFRALTDSVDADGERIEALLQLASTYIHFELHEQAAEIHTEVAKVALEFSGSLEEQVIAEVAMARHQLDQRDMDSALQRYQIAKNKAAEIDEAELADSAYRYIALSEAAQYLMMDANDTSNMIVDADTRENSQTQISEILAELRESATPEQAAALGQETTGDAQIDELIEMTKKNKKTLQAASQFFKGMATTGE